MRVCHYCELLIYDIAATLLTTDISNANLSANNTSNLSAIITIHLSTAASDNLSAPTNSNTATELTSKQNPKAKINPTKLEIVNSIFPHNQQDFDNKIQAPDVPSNNPETNQKQLLTSNIPLATITENKSLDVIFLFQLKEPSTTPLFSGAVLDTKLITAMYTDTKVDGHAIKLILDIDCTANARIITTNGVTKTPIALVGNDWLVKTNAVLNWNMQELQLSQNGQYTRVPVMCGHFKTTNLTTPLIEFKEEEMKPIWEAYQVSWANSKHNKLLPVLSWNDNSKGKQKEELIWKANQVWEIDNDQEELINWEWKENKKEKGKKKEEEPTPNSNPTYNSYLTPQRSAYCHPKLVCVDCGKKLSSIDACCSNDEEYTSATKFYCRLCIIEHFGRPKWVEKWDNKPCLACRKTLLDKRMWNNIFG
ncbi:hypothetical protein G9A89_022665 [Geosiphon pyriformis]|nr:hypothetical protein G9A89_022665 [Geosiphon pyriformis]